MRTNSVGILLELAVVLFCGTQIEALVNGTKPTIGQFPAHVIIYLPDNKQCGGSIITSRHILTASSCIFDENNELLDAGDIRMAGKWNMSDNTEFRPELTGIQIAAVYAHPQFDPYSKENDIAVLRLSIKLPLDTSFEQPLMTIASLNSRIVADQTACLLAGYAESDTVSGLNYVRLTIDNRMVCNQNDEYPFQIKNAMICAGGTDDGAVCKSDIGSGLYCKGNLSGILSFGAGCGKDYSSVYTQVRMYTKWLREQLWREDVPRAGPTPPPSNSSFKWCLPNMKVLVTLLKLMTVIKFL